MKVVVIDTPREVDDLVLEAISLRRRGFRNSVIARRLGISAAYVSTISNRMRDADERECGFWGENPKEIMGAYW